MHHDDETTNPVWADSVNLPSPTVQVRAKILVAPAGPNTATRCIFRVYEIPMADAASKIAIDNFIVLDCMGRGEDCHNFEVETISVLMHVPGLDLIESILGTV